MAFGAFFPIQSFLILTGGMDAKFPPKLLRSVAASTLLVVGTYMWIGFYSDLPLKASEWIDLHAGKNSEWGAQDESMSGNVDGVADGTSTYSSLVIRAGYHRELAWFGQDRACPHTHARNQPRVTRTHPHAHPNAHPNAHPHPHPHAHPHAHPHTHPHTHPHPPCIPHPHRPSTQTLSHLTARTPTPAPSDPVTAKQSCSAFLLRQAILWYRLVHAALASVGLRWLLPYLGVALRFGCWAGGCPWPLRRDPFDLALLSPSDPFSRLALFLPATGRIAPHFIFYATVPGLLPRAFPRAFPHPLALLRACLPTSSRLWNSSSNPASRWLPTRFRKAAKSANERPLVSQQMVVHALWALALVAFALACLHPKFRLRLLRFQWALAGRYYLLWYYLLWALLAKGTTCYGTTHYGTAYYGTTYSGHYLLRALLTMDPHYWQGLRLRAHQ
jgi:hypothetical protein